MKTPGYGKRIFFAFVLSGMASLPAFAGPHRRDSEKILQQDPEERYVMVTGSNIPQKIKLKSIGTETPYNLRIYTRREFESTGRQTVGGALSVLDPSITISGR